MAVKEFNVDLDIKGKVSATNVPNSTGSIVTWNTTSKVFGLRTNAQIISDLNLSSSFVPYTGATANVDLGSRSITSTGGFIGNASTATTLATARTINGTSFNGSDNITTANWGTSRDITIGDTTKSVNGSGNVAWSLSEIGASSVSHAHPISDIVGLQTELNKIGNLPSLTTTNKTSLVGAVNEVNNIQIGGRNLLINSKLLEGRTDFYGGLTTAVMPLSINLEKDKEYIFTYKNNNEQPRAEINTITLRNSNGETVQEITTNGDGSETIFKVNVDGVIGIAFYSVWKNAFYSLKELMLTSGNKIVDWTPAIEDQVSDWNETDSTKHSFIKNKPTIPTVNNGQLTLSTGTGLSGSANFTANQAGESTFSVAVASTHKLPTTAEWNALSTQTLSDSTSNLVVSNTVQRAALTGDVTAAQNSNATTIANSAVTHAKYQNIATQRILGRGATGTGNVQELTLGANLTLSTAGVLSATDTNTTYTAGNGLTLSGTAFSVNYGTSAGTSAQGDDARINNGQTAFDSLGNYTLRTNLNNRLGLLSSVTGGSDFYYSPSTDPDKPTGVQDGVFMSMSFDSGLWYSQLYADWRNNEWYVRTKNLGTWNSFQKLIHTGNISSELSGYVPTSRTITAGNGLSGGGNLTADRTLTLGTPSAITLTSTNSVAASSHTHAFTPGGTTAQYIRGDGSLAAYVNTTYSAGNGLTLSETIFSLPVTQSGSGNAVTAVAQTSTGITVTKGSNFALSDHNHDASYLKLSGGDLTGILTAPSFLNTSLRKYKKNIKEFTDKGLDLINSLEIVEFDRDDVDEQNIVGIIADDTSSEFLNKNHDAVDLYKTIFIQAKAIQELSDKVDKLTELVNKLAEQ